ncbi:hypothetical protein Ocin01_12696 [Orchesella cincta]|uniref:Uncharacterized protein n=1 Tax=Orchesella cincta TaxID=48709 RepID=A0A1D2MLT5_ORCCI|nr:hypothetical protein Ocin01_12696 [Orchesella cincta]
MNNPVSLILACLVGLSGGVPEDPPKLSYLAIRMEGVCCKTVDLQGFNTTCTDSANTIYPNKLPKPTPGISEEVFTSITKQNDRLLNQLIQQAIYSTPLPKIQSAYGFQQLDVVASIYQKVCPAVPPSFLQIVIQLFQFINFETSNNRTEYLPDAYHKWIMTLLNKCVDSVKEQPIKTEICKERVLGIENCTSYICTKPEHEFRLMRTDPMMDVIFKLLELVQSVCFPSFLQSSRMFHFFHLTIADTFTESIKMRWTTQIEEITFWKRLLGPFFDVHLLNMERCNEGIISQQKFHFRIPRTSMPAQIRLTAELQKLRMR